MSVNIGPQGLKDWQGRNQEWPPGMPAHCTQVTEARSCKKKKGAAHAVMPHDPNQSVNFRTRLVAHRNQTRLYLKWTRGAQHRTGQQVCAQCT